MWLSVSFGLHAVWGAKVFAVTELGHPSIEGGGSQVSGLSYWNDRSSAAPLHDLTSPRKTFVWSDVMTCNLLSAPFLVCVTCSLILSLSPVSHPQSSPERVFPSCIFFHRWFGDSLQITFQPCLSLQSLTLWTALCLLLTPFFASCLLYLRSIVCPSRVPTFRLDSTGFFALTKSESSILVQTTWAEFWHFPLNK